MAHADGRIDWSPRDAAGIPDGLILFDGVCLLCSRWVRFVVARDTVERWRFVPIQSAYGHRLAASFGIDLQSPETNVVVRDGIAYFKLDAAIVVLQSWSAWSWVRLAYLLPRTLRNWIYDRVARNRYRLFGRTDTCTIPSSVEAKRFLTHEPS